MGDPIETSAINTVFASTKRAEKLIVGSVKSNVGHLEACAAIVGIIKVVECLERGKIPPQMHFSNPNPKINFDSIKIPTTMLDWPQHQTSVRRAAINSFGFGGTNGHVVLENFPARPGMSEQIGRPYLFKVSAMTERTLEAMCTSYATYIEDHQPKLSELAHTLLARRSTHTKSAFIIAATHDELVRKLRGYMTDSSKVLQKRPLSKPNIGFVFTGQGAAW